MVKSSKEQNYILLRRFPVIRCLSFACLFGLGMGRNGEKSATSPKKNHTNAKPQPESKTLRQTIRVAQGGRKMSVITLCTTEVDQIRISFIVFAMSSHAFRAASLLSRRSKFSAHNLINVFFSSLVSLVR